jgi:Cof subfamily protein (haloacid dehalogenase superfamily)
MIRLFVSDLDNTLFNREKKIEEKDKQAIRELIEAGVNICLASGRMDKELIEVMQELGVAAHRISQNGAFIYTCQNECLHSAAFDGHLARQLYEESLPFGLACFISQENEMIVPKKTEEIRAIEKRMKLLIEEQPTVIEEIGKTIYPSKLCFFGAIDKIKELERHINRKYQGKLDTFISDKDCIDFMPPGISKGAALRQLLNHLGLQPEEVACIGDSFNDVSMLRLTPHSFAMSHADPAVQKEANHFADSVADAAQWVLKHNRQLV